ncbi:MAG: hypothetical protein JW881_14620 [Spirochaetales bacterium]|nr:hypothetical protein [Spirochaetales bacterium]
MKKATGVCLGASTVSFVTVAGDGNHDINIVHTESITHNGDPKGVFGRYMASLAAEGNPVIVTGRKFRELVNLVTISEPEAIEAALGFVNRDGASCDAVASLGGETFIVYPLDTENRISSVVTGNKCASGTGEFFLQQIKRMNLSIDEAVALARDSPPFKVSGRCSVFCKSDCTHALNKGTPLGEVTAGLAYMIADKAEELLRKVPHNRIIVVGGVTKNDSVVDFLKKKIDCIEIPPYAACFEALGAALAAFDRPNVPPLTSMENVFKNRKSSFSFLEPLSRFTDKVVFKEMERSHAKDGDRCIIGLDVGSTTTKAVIIKTEDNRIVGSVYLRTNGNPVRASRECYRSLLEQVPENIEIIGLGVTGSGRQIAGLHALTGGIINEIVAHATAATYFDGDVDTIFEIGGQDAKYTYIVNKVPADYAMNEACSAGTGSFLEEAAYESLGIDVKEIAPIAMKSTRPPNFNDQCAAFISSDIKTAFQEDISREDVVAGLVYSICLNYINRVKGTRTVGRKVFMQGGVCYNSSVPIAMAAITGKEIIVPPEPGLMGAFGVALEVKQKLAMGFLEEQRFSLKELAEREVTCKKSFVCKGGKEKCDRKCAINIMEINGKTYPFGGACNKYYNMRYNIAVDPDSFDYVKKRYELLFKKYSPPLRIPDNAPTVGINQSFHTHTLYPLYYNFFSRLGMRVVLADTVKEEGIERELTSFCYPMQISLGMFSDLLDKDPDYIFVPMLIEMFVNDEEHHRTNYNATCVFVSGEPFILKQAFKDRDFKDGKIIDTVLDFSHGYRTQEHVFIDIAGRIGIDDIGKIREAYAAAVEMQHSCNREMNRLAGELLERLDDNPDDFAIVLFGRPYNAFCDDANKGIPQKFASRGITVIPYDMLDYQEEEVGDHMYWEIGKKILKAARIVKRHPQLFATYITNFVCAPDSMIIPQFRTLMDVKPSLTLELDGHTADAGINTRIEAALDIIRNYRKIIHTIRETDYSDYRPARLKVHQNINYFVASNGEKVPLTDKRVVVVLPSMGDIATPIFAAGFRSLGINAFAMPEATSETLKKGRAYTTGKECLPFILCVGHLIDYMDRYWDGRKYIAFFVNESAGPCRVGQYNILIKDVIRRKRLRNVTTLTLSNEDAYAGMGPVFAMMAWENITAGDVLDDVRSAIWANALDPERANGIFSEEFEKIVEAAGKGVGKLYKPLRRLAHRLRHEAPARRPIEESKYIAMCGEIYVRRDGFCHKWLNRRFAEKGFIIKDAYVGEFILYLEWLIKKGLLEPAHSLIDKIEMIVRNIYMGHVEKKIKRILSRSLYYQFERTEIDPLIKHSEHILPKEHKGETALTLGTAMKDSIEKLAGIINIGPFGCMPVRFTEALMIPEMKVMKKIETKKMHDPAYRLPDYFNEEMGIPFLSIESDGNVYPQIIESRLETFMMQAERMAALMEKYRNENKVRGRLKN